MSRTIPCVVCGVTLNLPEQAAGRRLKCPKCGTKFQAPGADPKGSPSGRPGTDIGDSQSTFELSKNQSSGDVPVMPTAAGDLRETFDMAMMTEAAGTSTRSAKGAAGGRSTADALALFNEPTTTARRKSAAEARASARRCPTCGGVVATGMSLCQTCGLDLETGMRVGLDDDLAPPPPSRPSGLPLPLAIIGAVCGAFSVAGAVAAVVNWQRGGPFFAIVALFCIYAVVQFLRGKSIKLLLVALSVGALINVAFLIVVPIIEVNTNVTEVHHNEKPDDPNTETTEFRTGELDTQRISTGMALLFFYAVVSIYLLSPTAQKGFRK